MKSLMCALARQYLTRPCKSSLARRRQLPIASLDKKLNRAAKDLGLSLL